MTDFEIAVAGGGLAGLTAALFAARCGRSTVALTGGPSGGPLLSIERIEDFPGFPEGIPGYELLPLVQEQAAGAGTEFQMTEVESLEAAGDGWSLTTGRGELRAGAVIVATGSRTRELGVPGEERLTGRGISHCASCDGPLYRDRVVAVVGGGDSALQEALALAAHAQEVIVFHRGPAFSAQQTYRQRALESPRISVRYRTIVEEILGEQAVTGLRTRDLATGEVAHVEVAGLFVYIGAVPLTGFLPDRLQLDDRGRVPTDSWMRTELPGLLAAGDVRSESAAQAVAAAGDGATAALAAHRYLTDRSWRGASSHLAIAVGPAEPEK